MQTMNANGGRALRNFLSPFLSGVSGLFGRRSAREQGKETRDFSTPVEAVINHKSANADVAPANSELTKSTSLPVANTTQRVVVREVAIKNLLPGTYTAESDENKTNKRFRRTKEEIRLGLTREQAIQFRQQGMTAPAQTPVVVVQDGKLFRRTAQEIAMGLTKEQAIYKRERERTAAPKSYKLKNEPPPKLNLDTTEVEKLESTLSPRIQARARAVHRYRAGGGKAVLTPDTLNEIEAMIAAGKVTKCPPGIDSDGYDHFNQVDTTAAKDAA